MFSDKSDENLTHIGLYHVCYQYKPLILVCTMCYQYKLLFECLTNLLLNSIGWFVQFHLILCRCWMFPFQFFYQCWHTAIRVEFIYNHNVDILPSEWSLFTIIMLTYCHQSGVYLQFIMLQLPSEWSFSHTVNFIIMLTYCHQSGVYLPIMTSWHTAIRVEFIYNHNVDILPSEWSLFTIIMLTYCHQSGVYLPS